MARSSAKVEHRAMSLRICEDIWLYSLGITEIDWKNLVLSFVHQGKKIIIQWLKSFLTN